MSVKKDLEDIKELRTQYPQLSHASNILNKYGQKLSNAKKDALDKLIVEYASYLKKMLKVTAYDRKSVDKKVEYLNGYYNFMHEHNLDHVFTSQGKFRPTILEEFLYLLFKDFIIDIKHQNDVNDVVGCGSVKAYSNIYVKAKNFKEFIENPEIGINAKDQDYAIYRSFNISVNELNPIKINIPAVAIEAKTYIDKTMLDSIIATAEKIKSGNPHTRFAAVAERYEVSTSVDPAYSRIDQIYILRKAMHKNEWQDIDNNVVWRLFEEVQNHLNRSWSDVEARIKNEGVII